MDDKENQIQNPDRAVGASPVDFIPAEAPTVPHRRAESFSGFTDANYSAADIQPIPDRSSSSSGGQPNRLSALKANRPVSDSPLWPKPESFGHIYIDPSGSYQRGPDTEAARQVPRTAGRP